MLTDTSDKLKIKDVPLLENSMDPEIIYCEAFGRLEIYQIDLATFSSSNCVLITLMSSIYSCHGYQIPKRLHHPNKPVLPLHTLPPTIPKTTLKITHLTFPHSPLHGAPGNSPSAANRPACESHTNISLFEPLSPSPSSHQHSRGRIQKAQNPIIRSSYR